MNKLHIILFIVFVLFNGNAKAERHQLSIAVNPHILKVFKQWTQTQDCWDINHFNADHSSRGAVELVVMCKALHRSGIDFEFDFYPSPNYTRSLYLANQRKIHSPGESIWFDEIDHQLYYVSTPVIERGEMKKGIFTLAGHVMLDQVKTRQELAQYVGISKDKWHHDWAIISSLTPQLINAPSTVTVHKMIAKGRADFTLGEFNNKMEIGLENVVIVPIPNLYVSMQQSRHFIVRKDVRNSALLFEALEKGLLLLKTNNEIQQAYQKSGFTPADISEWKDISQ